MDPDTWHDEERLAFFSCCNHFAKTFLANLSQEYKDLIDSVYDEQDLSHSCKMRWDIEDCFHKAGVYFHPYMVWSDVPEDDYLKTLEIFINKMKEGGR